MHNAPSVSYPAGRSSLGGWALLVLCVAAVAGVAGWCIQAQPSAGRVAIAVAITAGSGLVAWRAWKGSPAGLLSWDGLGWTWTVGPDAQTGVPEVALDAQRLLLLRWEANGRARWLWLERRTQPARWDDLRRAVYSRARPEALPGAQPPGEAKP